MDKNNVDFGLRFARVVPGTQLANVSPEETEPKKDFNKRFSRVMKGQQTIEEEYKLLSKYNTAMRYLRPGIAHQVINFNLCVLSATNQWTPVSRGCFMDNLSEEEKNKAYAAIKKYLRFCAENYRPNGKQKGYIHYDNVRSNTDRSTFPKRVSVHGYDEHDVAQDIPNKVTELLYEFTEGDEKLLCQMAMLVAILLSEPLITKRPIVILANKVAHKTIYEFIYSMAERKICHLPFAALTRSNGLEALYHENLAGCFANVMIEEEVPESELQIKKLKRIMNGNTLDIKHPHFPGKLYFNNSLPFIYITECHDRYLKMRNLYQAMEIKIPLKKNLRVPFHLEYGDHVNNHNWVAREFAHFGLAYVNNPKTVGIPVTKIKEDDVFQSFVDALCILGEDEVGTKKELHEAYCQYYKRRYGDEPLSNIMFGKKFAAFGNFETTRPHSSRKQYPYCFKGVSLDKDRYEKLLCSDECSRYKSEYPDFAKFVNNCVHMKNIAQTEIYNR